MLPAAQKTPQSWHALTSMKKIAGELCDLPTCTENATEKTER
jgi:hypothetical protein